MSGVATGGRRTVVADVVVVGGGPAGAAAAIRLARAGRDVVLVDKATFPRDKICGDGLTTGALRLLDDLGLDPAVRCRRGSPSRTSWCARRPDGRRPSPSLAAGASTRRWPGARSWTRRCSTSPARAGARVFEGHACTGADQRADRIVLTVEGLGAVHARYAIAADGMWSPMRKHLGVATPGYLGEWHAFRQYLTGVGPRAARELFVWFEPDLLPGYAWSFPLPDGRANVGFGIQRSTVDERTAGSGPAARWTRSRT